jgi:hypothetical protein
MFDTNIETYDEEKQQQVLICNVCELSCGL